jgi:hypothetical protein
MHGYLNVFVCVCMVCDSLKVHFVSTTKFVDQIIKDIAKGEW